VSRRGPLSAGTTRPPGAAKALPYFLGKVKLPFRDPRRTTATFDFTYSEARGLGFANSTHHRNICELMDKGLIDPVARGGLKSFCKAQSVFKLSDRWRHYGTPKFKNVTPWRNTPPSLN